MFINTDLFTIVKESDYPDRDSLDFESYWLEMENYCKNGYSVGGQKITGRHFWYLNFWKIRGVNYKTLKKSIIRPRFTELDYERFYVIDRMYKEKKDCLWVKGRQNGSSETVAGGFLGYDFTFYPGSQGVIVAGEEKYSANTAKNVKRGLDDLFKTEFYKRRTPNRLEHMYAYYNENVVNEQGNKIKYEGGFLSEIYMRTALNNPQVVSSLSPTGIVFEEAGAWKKGVLLATRSFVNPSLYAENGLKTGYAIYIATGGEAYDSIDDVEEMFYDPDSYNLLTFDNSQYDDDENLHASGATKQAYFIPAWKFEILDDNGNTLKDKSIENITNNRKIKKGKELHTYISHKPLKPSEVFSIVAGGYFREDVITNLINRKAEILKNRELTHLGRVGDLLWELSDGTKVKRLGRNKTEYVNVVFEDNPLGETTIYEFPYKDRSGNVPGLLYKGATDSYDRDEANSSDSKGDSRIIKGFLDIDHTSNMFVAEHNSRPEKAEYFYEETAKLHIFYNARNLIEYSNLRIFDFYERGGLEYLLRERPYLALATYFKDSKIANRYGVDPMLKPHALAKLADYLGDINNVKKIYSLKQLNAFIRFKLGVNCDITMSSAWAFLHLSEDDSLMLNHIYNIEPKNKDSFISYKTKGNKLVIV